MITDDKGSISRALDHLKDGSHIDTAARKLWEHAFDKLTRIARGMLKHAPKGAADEEDIALSAFHSLCAGAARGHFPDLDSRDNLWRVLYVITSRKVTARNEHDTTRKRDASRLVDVDIEAVTDLEPGPEFIAMMMDELRFLLSLLRDEGLRRVARLILEGLTNQEIAERLDCHVRTIERKRELIRQAWERESTP
jgi:DNA-directed RNA polymerase specialized sigma24 family protein